MALWNKHTQNLNCVTIIESVSTNIPDLFPSIAREITLRRDAKAEALSTAFRIAFLQVECVLFTLRALCAFDVYLSNR